VDVISYVTAFLSRNLLLCLYIDKKALWLLREDNCGLYRIKYFSHKDSQQLLVMAELSWEFSRILWNPSFFLLRTRCVCLTQFVSAWWDAWRKQGDCSILSLLLAWGIWSRFLSLHYKAIRWVVPDDSSSSYRFNAHIDVVGETLYLS